MLQVRILYWEPLKKGKALKDSLGNELAAGDRVFVAKSGVFNGQAHLGRIKSVDSKMAYVYINDLGGYWTHFERRSIIKITQDILECEI